MHRELDLSNNGAVDSESILMHLRGLCRLFLDCCLLELENFNGDVVYFKGLTFLSLRASHINNACLRALVRASLSTGSLHIAISSTSHPRARSPIQSITHPLTHSLNHSFTHSLTSSQFLSFSYLPTHPLTCSPIHFSIHSLTHYSLANPFIRVIIHSTLNSLIYLLFINTITHTFTTPTLIHQFTHRTFDARSF